jgi:peptide/nickel transport system substrate-binding protein
MSTTQSRGTKKVLGTILAFILALSFVGCTGNNTPAATTPAANDDKPAATTGPLEGGELRIGSTAEIDSLDPYIAVGGDTKGQVIWNIFEGLVRPDTTGELQPAVAKDYSIEEDGKVYILHLREGVKFHNGNDVTPADVRYSFDQALNSAAGLEGFDNVDKVEVSDAGEIKITLKENNTEFLASLTNAIIPADYKDQATAPIGTGAFKFVSYTPQQELVLEKNENYWQAGLPHLDKVTIVYEVDTNAELLSLQSGNIDGAGIATTTAEVLNLDDFNVVERNSNAVQLFGLNHAYEPLKDVRVRQAISYAVDRDQIITDAFSGYGTKVGTPIIPGLGAYFNASLTNAYNLDIAKAKQLLADAGYADGFDLEITVPSNYIVHVDTAQVIVNQLAQVGIKATIKQVGWPTWLSETYVGRNYQATIISVGGASLSPKNELARYRSTADDNFFNFNSAEFDKVYAQAAAEVDPAKKKDLYNQAQQIISDEAVSVYIQDISGLTAFNKNFEGLVGYPVYGVIDFAQLYRVG